MKARQSYRHQPRQQREGQWVRPILSTLGISLFLLLLLTLSNCSTLDERDECCEEVVIHFRYSRGAEDIFPKYIKGMHYYVFDQKGVLLHQVQKGEGEELQHFKFRQVPAGKYTVIALGNAEAYTRFGSMEVGRSTLAQLQLQMNHLLSSQPPFEGDSDPLYYGMLEFEVKNIPAPQHFICDMSNAHCRLIVTIRWQETQPEDRGTPFELRLVGVPRGYQLARSYPIALAVVGEAQKGNEEPKLVHRFPYLLQGKGESLCNHIQRAPYLAGRVRAELQTLRYYDEWIPTLSVWQGGREVMAPIQLEKVFKSFKWLVSGNVEQRYEIELLLYDDGRVEVRPGGVARILDWVDGGRIG